MDRKYRKAWENTEGKKVLKIIKLAINSGQKPIYKILKNRILSPLRLPVGRQVYSRMVLMYQDNGTSNSALGMYQMVHALRRVP